MPMRELCLSALAVVALAAAAHAQNPYGIGRAATPAEIAGWNIDIDRDGNNLPAGRVGERLVGGQGTLATPNPVRTVGSYWPYAPTLFDYIRRAMPQNAPQSLSNDDVYAVSAYIFYLNGLLAADSTLGAKTLRAIKMPNRSMFVSDPRPDVKNPACMTGCQGNK
jgi:S-disulfanyl-L-cysteine oxidoreductase SoxD